MTLRSAEVMAGLVLLAFTVFAWREASAIRGPAAFFPSVIIGALGALSLIYLTRSVLAGRSGEAMFERGFVFVAVLGLSLVYVYAVAHVGYVSSTLVFIPALAWVIGFRRPTYLAVTTVVYIASVYVTFEIVFQRPLPSEMLLEFVRGLG